MNPNQQLIEEFYAGFASRHADTMASCYHKEIVFQDPVFGVLKGKDARDMWHMLIEKSDSQLKIDFSNIEAREKKGSAQWSAAYLFGKAKRKVFNEIKSEFEFRDGLIVRHTDFFDIWKWSRQALGASGLLLGWTGFLHQKIRKQAIGSLRSYQQKKLRENRA